MKLPVRLLASLVEEEDEPDQPKVIPILAPVVAAEAAVMVGIFMGIAVMVNGRSLWSAIAAILIGGEW